MEISLEKYAAVNKNKSIIFKYFIFEVSFDNLIVLCELCGQDKDSAKRNWAIVKLGSTWSKNISVFYAIVVDMAAAKSSVR